MCAWNAGNSAIKVECKKKKRVYAKSIDFQKKKKKVYFVGLKLRPPSSQ